MTDYWVDDGGDNSTGASWATAYTSFNSLITAVPAALTTTGNRIFVGDDHNDAARATYTGTGVGALPSYIISCDRADTAAVPAYKVGTGNQLYNTAGVTIDGGLALSGIRVVSGGNIVLSYNSQDFLYVNNCKLVLAANGTVSVGATSGSYEGFGYVKFDGCTIDLTADGTTARTGSVLSCVIPAAEFRNLSFVQPGGGSVRTGVILGVPAGTFVGCDFSGFTSATECELMSLADARFMRMMNCKTKSSVVVFDSGTSAVTYTDVELVNVGSADAPEMLYKVLVSGKVISDTSVYLGATVETVPVSWKMDSNANCSYSVPLYTPWIYGTLSSTGSKTFTIHIANNTADLTTAEAWIEVEFMGTANSPLSTLATDRAANVLAAGVTTGRDEDAAWTGSAGTYEQKLEVTATVNEEGLYRARVCLGKASAAAVYIDPKVTVS